MSMTLGEKVLHAIERGHNTTADITVYLGFGKDTNGVSACLRRMMKKGVVEMRKHKGRNYTYSLTGKALTVRRPSYKTIIREVEPETFNAEVINTLNNYLYRWKA